MYQSKMIQILTTQIAFGVVIWLATWFTNKKYIYNTSIIFNHLFIDIYRLHFS